MQLFLNQLDYVANMSDTYIDVRSNVHHLSCRRFIYFILFSQVLRIQQIRSFPVGRRGCYAWYAAARNEPAMGYCRVRTGRNLYRRRVSAKTCYIQDKVWMQSHFFLFHFANLIDYPSISFLNHYLVYLIIYFNVMLVARRVNIIDNISVLF